MYLKTIFELTMTIDSEKFGKIYSKLYDVTYTDNDECVDNSLVSKGITVIYRNSQYKKKVKLIVNPNLITDSDKPEKIFRKLGEYVGEYFRRKYTLNDFSLTGMILTTDINVGNREKVAAYLKVLQRLGKVKGFSPANDKWFEDGISFCLEGNSNGIDFLLYDLESHLREQLSETEHGRKKLKAAIEKSKGILRVEVRLTEAKVIRAYTDESDTAKQLVGLFNDNEKVFLGIFMRIVPFGNFYKKDKTVELIRREVTDNTLKRRMLYLLDLIPKKKSLLLAQKALNYRRIEDVMEAFAAIDLSPVTLSKRHDGKMLDNLYKYL